MIIPTIPNQQSLKELEVLFLDCQTTGASPANGHLLEISWCLTNAHAIAKNPALLTIESFVAKLPKGEEVPRRIRQLTGIGEAELEGALSIKKIKQALGSLLLVKPLICAIHYARFEKPFLDELKIKSRQPFPAEIICTHEIAKKLHPDLPSRGIRALSGYYGLPLHELKRSGSHVQATMHIWQKLIEELSARGLNSLSDLQTWLSDKPTEKVKRGKRQYPMPKEIRLGLPNKPGVYRFIGAQNQILYIGKATSLRDRVNSYFRGQKGRNPRQLEMLTQARDLQVTVTETMIEACLLESDEIKTISPPYNVALKKGNGRFVFTNREFSEFSDTSSSELCLGPFLESQLATFLLIHAAIEGRIYSEELFFGLDDPKLIKKGIKLFLKENGLSKHLSLRELLALGMLHLREKIKLAKTAAEAEAVEIEIDEDEDKERELIWTPELVAASTLSLLCQTAGFYRRSKRLSKLAHATVSWPLDPKQNSWRVLTLENGRMMSAQTANHPRQSARALSLTACDQMTYDRLRILDTELQRLQKNL